MPGFRKLLRGGLCGNPLIVDTNRPEEIDLPEERPVWGTEIDCRFMPVCKPWQEVRGPALVAGPDDQVYGRDPFAAVEMFLHGLDVDAAWVSSCFFHFFEDLPGCEHDLVPAAIGKCDIEVEPGMILCGIFGSIDRFQQVIGKQGPVPHHLDAYPVPFYALVGHNTHEFQPEQGEQMAHFLLMA